PDTSELRLKPTCGSENETGRTGAMLLAVGAGGRVSAADFAGEGTAAARPRRHAAACRSPRARQGEIASTGLCVRVAFMRIASFSIALVLVSACGPDKPPSDQTHAETQPSASAEPTSEATSGGASSDVSRGVDALKNGDFATAKSAFEAAIAKNPRDAEAHHYLAVTLEKTNDKAGAEKEYKAALAIKPDLAEAAAN